MVGPQWMNQKAWHPTGQQYTLDPMTMQPVALSPPGIPRKHQDRSKYRPGNGSEECARRRDTQSAAYRSECF